MVLFRSKHFVTCAFFTAFVASAPLPAGIYETLWETDQKNQGLSASALESVEKGQKAGEIVLDERRGARDLFVSVVEDKLGAESYEALAALLDNYEFEMGKAEDALGANPLEDQEIDVFLDAALATEVFQQAFAHVRSGQIAGYGPSLQPEAFKELVKTLWFEPYDNFYRPKCSSEATHSEAIDSTGFEHVFVGEENGGGGLGGYHYWYTYYLDQKNKRVDFNGPAYGKLPGGTAFASIATIGFSLTHLNRVYEKPVGGFLVGASPELMLAWGTLAYLENESYSSKDTKTIPVDLEGGQVELVLFRESRKECSAGKPVLGNHIRTFYPKLVKTPTERGAGQTAAPAPQKVRNARMKPGSEGGTSLRIARALVNAPGSEERGKEWIELENVSNAEIDLRGMVLEDTFGRQQTLRGSVAVGETLRIAIPADSIQLRNQRGTITLVNASGQTLHLVSYDRAEEGVPVEFSAP